MSGLNLNEIDKEVLPYLSPKAAAPVRAMAMQYFLGLTGTEEGRTFTAANDKYLLAITGMLSDDQSAIAKDAYLAMVNLCTDQSTSEKLAQLSTRPKLIHDLLEYILKKDSINADIACTILSNMSRSELCAHRIVDEMLVNETLSFERLIFVFCQENYNTHCKLHYLGPLLSNLTQIRMARLALMDHRKCVIQRLLPYLEYKKSLVRRGGIVGALRNCCFETSEHEWLLSDSVDILPRLLLPLAGPEELDDEDNERLPEELQYLEPDKTREEDPDIRKMLCETINKLCSTKKCRDMVKDKNTYVILREFHKWEKDPAVIQALEATISVLIMDEPEKGMQDLNEVEIPTEMEEKFRKMDEEAARDIAAQTEKMSLES